jgi:hypothetical protein
VRGFPETDEAKTFASNRKPVLRSMVGFRVAALLSISDIIVRGLAAYWRERRDRADQEYERLNQSD